MFFKKELYIGKDNEFLNELIKALKKNSIKHMIVHNNSIHSFDLPRGAAVGRNSMQDFDLISVYVKTKDYGNALDILNTLDHYY